MAYGMTNQQVARAMGDRVWLQRVGYVEAIPAGEVEAGMTITFNFGITNRVVAVEPNAKGTSVKLTVEDEDGNLYTSRKRSGTLVAARFHS